MGRPTTWVDDVSVTLLRLHPRREPTLPWSTMRSKKSLVISAVTAVTLAGLAASRSSAIRFIRAARVA